MNQDNNTDEYEQLLYELEKKYEENPKGTVKALKNTLRALNNSSTDRDGAIKNYDSKGYQLFDFDYKSSQMFIYIIGLLILSFMFLFHIGGENYEDGIGLYIFGAVFLAAGQSIGTFIPIFGLIFLFSHGGIGMGTMVSSFLSPILDNPVMTDSPPQKLIIYIVAAIALIVIGFLITIVRNLSRSFKEKYYSMFLPIIFYIIGMGMIVALYRNFDMIYKMLL